MRTCRIGTTSDFRLRISGRSTAPLIYIGEYNDPTALSRVCLDIVDSNVYFNFSSFPGFTTQSATVSWKLKGNILDPAHWSSPSRGVDITCAPTRIGDQFVCKLPFSDILGVSSPTTSLRKLLAGMCPNGDRAGLGLYINFLERPGESNPARGFRSRSHSSSSTLARREMATSAMRGILTTSISRSIIAARSESPL